MGIGGGFCKIESLFALLASVGLTVLAPSPVAWDVCGNPGITDILLAEDDGVAVPLPLSRAGDLVANEADLLWSGVPTVELDCPCLEGGCKDLVFAALDAVRPRAPSVYVFPPPMLIRVEAAASERPWRD